jgi:hypothetical protein
LSKSGGVLEAALPSLRMFTENGGTAMSRLHLALAAALLSDCSTTVEPPAAAGSAVPEAAAPARAGAAEVAARAPAAAIEMTAQDKADLRAILAASRPGIPFTLSMSDPVHHRFFVRHMNRAGITSDRYPQLFRVTDAARRLPTPRIERPVMADVIRTGAAATDSLVQPIQMLTSLGSPDNGASYSVSALSSVPGTPQFSQMTVALYDSQMNPIGNAVTVSSPTMSPADLKAATSGSMDAQSGGVIGMAVAFWQDQNGTAHHNTVQAAMTTVPTTITNTNPMPQAGQTQTILCLARTLGNCSYSPATGTGSNVLMPVTGNVVFSAPISQVASTQTARITMTNPQAGGGCTIAATGSFFGDPNTHINGGTISWNIANMQFQPAWNCLQPNDYAIYNLTLALTVGGVPTLVTITSNQTQDPTDPSFLVIPQLIVQFSCLPDGTQLRLRGGGTVLIENVRSGQEIVLDQTGRTGVVESKLRGRETPPIVVLRTAGNRRLRATDGHPVMTDRGPVLAGVLRPGDRVMTSAGPDEIVSVGLERFDGYVWNLNIGPPPANMLDPALRGSTFLANGIVVGDNIMQFVENRRAQNSQAARNMRMAPPEWHRDIQSAVEDAR